jgi:hypothetical protein
LPRRHVHAVAIDIVTLDDDVAQIDPDAKIDPPVGGYVLVSAGHALQNRHGALHRADDTGELHQGAVTHELHDAPFVRGNFRIDQLGAMRLERHQGSRLVSLHEPAVAHHVGGQDGGETAFHVGPPFQ